MDPRIVQLLSHINEEHIDLLARPPMRTRERSHRQRLDGDIRVLVVPGAKLLISLVFRPAVCRPLETGVDDVDEADFSHDVFKYISVSESAAELFGGAVEKHRPFPQSILFLKSAVVRPHNHVNLLQLNVAAGGEVVIDFDKITLPVLDTKVHHSAVDIVKGPGVSPLLIYVINKECDIGWDKAWLNGREVDSNNLRLRMFIPKVNRPNAGPSANIENTVHLRIGQVWGRKTQFVVKGKKKEMVL